MSFRVSTALPPRSARRPHVDLNCGTGRLSLDSARRFRGTLVTREGPDTSRAVSTIRLFGLSASSGLSDRQFSLAG